MPPLDGTAPGNTPDAASVLARELVADIERYNDSMISTGFVPRQAIQEARAIFRGRVTPALYPVFERALGNHPLLARGAEGLVPDDDTELAARAGVQSRGRRLLKVGLTVFLLAMVGTIVWQAVRRASGADVIARVPIATPGTGGETPLAVQGPTTLTVAVAADGVKWSGRSCLMLDVEAFRGETSVARYSCCGWRPKRGSNGSALLVYRSTDACNLAVPTGGVDRFRVGTRLDPPGRLTFEGLEIRVER